jgi:glycosyltransferase involved in cell wall biosynthesis
MSVLEAMAAGMPVVTTPVGGIPDLIENGVDGYMVPPGDKEALAQVLDQLLRDPALQERVGMAARRKIQGRFSAEVVVPQLEKLYAELQVAPTSAGSSADAACATQV